MFKVKETFSQMKHRLSTAKGKAVVVFGALTLGVTNAMAVFTGEEGTFDTAPLETLAGVILAVLAVIWVIKKALGLARN